MSETEQRIPQEQIDALVAALERYERRRKLMLAGYLAALVLLVVGQIVAFFLYATAPRDRSMGWVFLVPFALVGTILWAFGRLARKQKVPPRADPD